MVDVPSTSGGLPRIRRADSRLILLGEWWCGNVDRQRAAVDAAIEAWRSVEWPDSLIQHTVYGCTDESTVFHLSQWMDEPTATLDWKNMWSAVVDDAVPGFERRGVTSYRHYRSDQPDNRIEDAGCVVFVVREFDEPTLSSATQMVDTLFAAPEAQKRTPGLISANFFISLDGARVLNYAEWTTEEAHRSLAGAAPSTRDTSPEWDAVHAWPGLKSTEFKRCTRWRSAIAAA